MNRRNSIRHGEQAGVFWEAVDCLLDARLDPLDDPEVQAFLHRHPEHLDEFSRLIAATRQATAELATAELAPGPASGDPAIEATVPASLRRKLVAAAAVLVGLAGAVIAFGWPNSTGTGTTAAHAAVQRTSPTPVPMPEFAPRGKVRTLRVALSVRAPNGQVRKTTISEGRLTAQRIETLRVETPRATTPHGIAITTTLASLTSRLR